MQLNSSPGSVITLYRVEYSLSYYYFTLDSIIIMHDDFSGQVMEKTPSLVQLLQYVAFRIANQWRDIGIQLNFKVEELDEVEQNNKRVCVEECCKAMLYLWRSSNVSIEADQLINAIEQAEEVGYAAQLRQLR